MTRLMAEFAATDAVLAAIADLRERRLEALDVYSPYPVREIEAALAIPRSRIPYWAGAAAVLGGTGAYGLQWWMNAYNYPLDVGGRPPHMPAAFVPITFEMAVLAASFTAFLAVLTFAGLPRLWHPVFETEGFESASIDRFWLSAELPRDAAPDDVETALLASGALRVVRTA